MDPETANQMMAAINERDRLRAAMADICQAWFFGTLREMGDAIEKGKLLID